MPRKTSVVPSKANVNAIQPNVAAMDRIRVPYIQRSPCFMYEFAITTSHLFISKFYH